MDIPWPLLVKIASTSRCHFSTPVNAGMSLAEKPRPFRKFLLAAFGRTRHGKIQVEKLMQNLSVIGENHFRT